MGPEALMKLECAVLIQIRAITKERGAFVASLINDTFLYVTIYKSNCNISGSSTNPSGVLAIY